MIASGVFAGVFDLEYGLSRKDHAGRTIGEELERLGYAGEQPVGGRPVGALFELHIEQGPILEAEGQRIGIVTGGQGARWYDCAVTGAETHAGSAPMEGRRDARAPPPRCSRTSTGSPIAMRRRPRHGRRVPGVSGLAQHRAPGRVRFTVDLRHPDAGTMDAMDTAAARGVRARARQRAGQLEFHLDEIWYAPPVAFDPDRIDAVRQAAARLGLSAREIVSGAGHDAVYVARVMPTAMIFVPCKDGISHAEIEYASPRGMRGRRPRALHGAHRANG